METKVAKYGDFIKEVEGFIAKYKLDSHTRLYITDNKTIYETLKNKINEVYDKFPQFSNRIHFIEIPKYHKSSIKLTYTHKFKRICSKIVFEEGLETLVAEQPILGELLTIDSLIDGNTKMYKRAVENRILYSYTDGVNHFSKQINVGLATVIYADDSTFTKTNSEEKKVNRLEMLSGVVSTKYSSLYFKLDENTTNLYNMIRIS